VTYKRIVFGTDGSASSARAERVAIALAKAGKAELIVAHVMESRAEADRVLASALAAATEAGVKESRLSGELREGAAAETLAELAEERDAGLLVISGGRGQQYLLGSTAHRLAHHATCDLLIVGSSDDDREYRRILIATDGSATADRAARKGFDLAEALSADVQIVFVGHPSTGKLVTDDTVAVFAGDVPVEVQLRDGDPAEEILNAADELDADLVIVGNKGMTGAKRFLLGSVPQKVSEYATRDLLICKTVTQAVSELSPGEGGIIERAGEKLAAFVDAAGELHVMSAKCTHMGCTVAWNPGETTFDCPCHGSRYSPLGEVVNGPAARPLAPA
jgi:nucleotide-binding universal stress UspA family protein/nitrite reductase/ring-hydroxylating ferredoxin subunit